MKALKAIAENEDEFNNSCWKTGIDEGKIYNISPTTVVAEKIAL